MDMSGGKVLPPLEPSMPACMPEDSKEETNKREQSQKELLQCIDAIFASSCVVLVQNNPLG
eukprot:164239-Amphidinium_carterae.1